MKRIGFLCLMLMLFCIISSVSAQVNVGDIIPFGQYEQDNDLGTGKEPIEWQVLSVEPDRMLLLSQYGLDVIPYNTNNIKVTWESSSLRKWLNEDFFRSAFSPEEQAMILQVLVKNQDNPDYDTPGGNSTKDRVFLLSLDDVNLYFRNNNARRCEATAYAKANGAAVSDVNGRSWWWLRSPGFAGYCAAYVGIGGNVIAFGDYVNLTDAVVRPAVWLSIEEPAAPSPAVEGDPAELAEIGENAYWEGDYETALRYLIPAADAGNADAEFRLGYMYVEGQGVPKDPTKGAYYLILAADQGDLYAQANLGHMYETGNGVTQSYENALNYYKKSADQGSPYAMNALGIMYEEGRGVTQSYTQAKFYYEKAAKENYMYAQYNLGYLYYYGYGVAESYENALKYFKLAADQGHSYSQYFIGWMYENGQGVKQNVQTAISYYQKAADQGNQDAIDQLNRLLSK